MSGRTVTKLALVGLGSIGRRHLRLLKELRPEVKVVLIRSGYGVSWPEEALAELTVPDIDAAIKAGVQAAIISSPAPFHVKQAAIFLEASIPLLIEKPLSINMEGLDSLQLFAQSKSAPVLVGYALRYSAAARHFRKLLLKKCVGEPTSAKVRCQSWLPDWRPEQDYRKTSSARAELGGGVLLELSHELDYANWFFGPFDAAQARLSKSGLLDINVEDKAEITLFSRAGYSVSVNLDFCSKNLSREITVSGGSGEIIWNILEQSVSLAPTVGEIKEWKFSAERDEMYRTQLLHFLDCVELGNRPEVTLEDGIEAMKLIDLARRSNQFHAPVSV